MWKSLRVRAWTVTFVVAVVALEARAQPAPPQEPPAPAPVAASPEPVATSPIAPSPEPAASTPDSQPASTTSPPDMPPSPGRAPASPPPAANEQPPMSGSAPPDPDLPVEQRLRRPAYLVARGGVDFGGDEIVQVIGADSTETIQAGQRYSVGVGVLYQPDPRGWALDATIGWALEATIGYKWQSSEGPNGKVGISRVPLEVIGSLTTGGFRFGIGVAVHFAPSFQCKVRGQCQSDVTLDDSIGAMLQLAYHFGDERGVDLGVRGTYIQYDRTAQVDGEPHTFASYDGTCFGFFMEVLL
jgi:hypothetical protein